MTGAARHLPRPATPAKRVRQALREHRAYPSPSAILMVVGCAVFAVVALGPLGALVVETLRALALQGAKALPRAVPIGQRWALLWRSAWLALAVSAASLVLGVLIATVLGRWRTGRLGTLRWLLLGLAAVPAYVHALAWTTAAYELGSALERAGLPFVALRGSPGAWWVEVMALLPIAVGMCLLAIESVPADLVEVGRTMRSDIGVLGRITLPLAAPMLVAAGGLIFLLSALDYGVPALFQVNVYALAIFADYSATNEAVSAFMMAVPLVLVGMAVVAVSQSGLRQLARRPRRRGAVGEAPSRWPAWFTAMEAVAVLALAAHLAVPLVSLIYQVGSAHTFLLAIDAARSEIAFSFGVALTVALACLPLALAAAQPLRAGGRAGRWWWLAVTSPLAMPAPLVGIGLIALWNSPRLPDIYGTTAMPVLASLARFAPLATLAVLAQLRQVDRELIDAARVHQSSHLQGWLQVRLPMLAPGLLAAAGVAFALSLGELGATLLVAPPGQSTLSMRIYNYLHYGASDAVAGLCLLLALSAVAAGLLAMTALLGWSRLLPSSGGQA